MDLNRCIFKILLIYGNINGNPFCLLYIVFIEAALTMDARGPGVSQVVRKTVVVKMAELSVAGFRDLVSSGVGGLLLLIPPGLAGLSAEAREAVLQLEEELVGGDLEIPVYFAEVNTMCLVNEGHGILN